MPMKEYGVSLFGVTTAVPGVNTAPRCRAGSSFPLDVCR
jgi:hypothetical protein